MNIVKNAATTVSVSAFNPVATVSGAPASFSTNRTFSIALDVDRNFGYWSTNASTGSTGSPTGSAQAVWNQFTMSGTSIVIPQTTTLRVYGASNGVSSATNTYTYTIDTTAPAVSGAPANVTTNKQFTISLDADEHNGYFSTNGSAYVQFGTSGTNIVINGTTTLSYYGRDALGNTSATNTRTYTFDTTAPVVSGAPAGMTTNKQFTISLDVNENYGYFSTNGSAYIPFTTAGTNIFISRTTVLSYYGRDALGNTGATNVRTYTIGLVAHWKFDEASGLSAADASGYGHTAYLSNMASPACWSAGKLGNALSFGNTDDYIKAESTSVLSALGSNNADLSVAYLMRLSSGWNGSWRHIMHKGNTLLERTFSMFLNPDNNRLHYRISTTSNFSEGGDTASEIPLGVWVHVAYVKQGNVLSIYFNGVKNSSVKLRGAVINNNGPVFIGRDPQQAGPSMTLDDVRVYSRALGSSEIASLAAAGGTTTVLAAMPAGKVAGGSAQIEPLVKNVGLSYTVSGAASPAAALTMSVPSGTAVDDGEEASCDIEMQFFSAPAGTTDWREIDSAYLDGSMVHAVTGMYRNTWRLPADLDLSKQYDVMIGGTRGGIPLIPYIVTGVDVTRVVTVRTTLDGFFALNSPCRGAGVISFANLTEDATVTIYSVSGKKIAELSSAYRNGNGIVSWNVASDDGRRVSPGVYLCRATSSAGSKTIRVMVLR
ncbi:MAG: T9SS type A sorting domain-containing protein [Spirochaetes bacterium]|nr:T9SS type A sorting domain-containing protein [Spirochaetota bacterium]